MPRAPVRAPQRRKRFEQWLESEARWPRSGRPWRNVKATPEQLRCDPHLGRASARGEHLDVGEQAHRRGRHGAKQRGLELSEQHDLALDAPLYDHPQAVEGLSISDPQKPTALYNLIIKAADGCDPRRE